MLQEIFDKVWNGLKDQGFVRSVDPESNFCKYRNGNGLCCAAGQLIPDEDYDTDMEGHDCHSLPYFTDRYSESQVAFIQNLQMAHDLSHNPDMMKTRLIRVAERFELNVPQ